MANGPDEPPSQRDACTGRRRDSGSRSKSSHWIVMPLYWITPTEISVYQLNLPQAMQTPDALKRSP